MEYNFIGSEEISKYKEECNAHKILFSFYIKHNLFSFEREWRILAPIGDANKQERINKIKYHKAAIRQVILGFNFFARDESFRLNSKSYKVTLLKTDLRYLLLKHCISEGIKICQLKVNTQKLEFEAIELSTEFDYFNDSITFNFKK